MDDLQERFLGQGFEQTESFVIDCDEKAKLIVKQSVSLRAIKNGFAVIDGRVVDPDTGEVIEGIEIVQRPDIVKVEVSE